jgi:hypothetical protein
LGGYALYRRTSRPPEPTAQPSTWPSARTSTRIVRLADWPFVGSRPIWTFVQTCGRPNVSRRSLSDVIFPKDVQTNKSSPNSAHAWPVPRQRWKVVLDRCLLQRAQTQLHFSTPNLSKPCMCAHSNVLFHCQTSLLFCVSLLSLIALFLSPPFAVFFVTVGSRLCLHLCALRALSFALSGYIPCLHLYSILSVVREF